MKNLNKNQKAELIAFAKLLGVNLSNEEIIAKFEEYYDEAIKSLPNEQSGECQVFNRPF